MDQQCVVAVYSAKERAQQAVHILERAGFPPHKVSLVVSHFTDQPDVAAELNYGDDSIQDAFVGAGLGGVLGTLVGATVLTLTGLGAVFLAGPLAVGLTGAVVGAFLGAMEGWGIHQSQIRRYEQLVQSGRALVVAHGSPVEVSRAHRLLKETQIEQIHVHAKTDEDDPAIDDRLSQIQNETL